MRFTLILSTILLFLGSAFAKDLRVQVCLGPPEDVTVPNHFKAGISNSYYSNGVSKYIEFNHCNYDEIKGDYAAIMVENTLGGPDGVMVMSNSCRAAGFHYTVNDRQILVFKKWSKKHPVNWDFVIKPIVGTQQYEVVCRGMS